MCVFNARNYFYKRIISVLLEYYKVKILLEYYKCIIRNNNSSNINNLENTLKIKP